MEFVILAAGMILAFVGVFMTAAEVRACEYERNNIGPFLCLLGLAVWVGATLELLTAH